jgi:hypothetical protein
MKIKKLISSQTNSASDDFPTLSQVHQNHGTQPKNLLGGPADIYISWGAYSHPYAYILLLNTFTCTSHYPFAGSFQELLWDSLNMVCLS